MPIQRLCKATRCINFRLPDSDYCKEHQYLQVEKDKKNEERKLNFYSNLPRTDSEFYHTGRWRKERKEYLYFQPYCVMCGDFATEIHHDWPDKSYLTDEDKFFDKSHWVGLCHDCHTKISNKRATGRPTSLNVFTGMES